MLHHPTTISTKYQAMGENFKLSSWILWLLYCLLFFWQSIVVALGRLLQSSQWTKTTFVLGTRPRVVFVSSRIPSLFTPVPAWYFEKAGLKPWEVLLRLYHMSRALLFRLKSTSRVESIITIHPTTLQVMERAREGEGKESTELQLLQVVALFQLAHKVHHLSQLVPSRSRTSNNFQDLH